MLTIGARLPPLTMAVQQGTEALAKPATLDLGDSGGRWRVLFFWPRDFTTVCPTDIVAYGELRDSFDERGADLIGASTDSVHLHLAWRKADPRLAECDFPWIADDQHELADALGIFDPVENMALRVTFIVDPEGIIQHVTANALYVGRNSRETLRVLDALQTGEACPCDWVPGDSVLNK